MLASYCRLKIFLTGRTLGSILFFSVIFIFSACTNTPEPSQKNPPDNMKMMLQADRDFSAMSAKDGLNNAFLEFLDSNGVLLRPGTIPIAGADAVDYLIAQNDTGYTMTWIAKDGMIAASGELGYTYGVYELKPKDGDTVLQGTYVNIWKKQSDGKWKFVLDSGNEGTGK